LQGKTLVKEGGSILAFSFSSSILSARLFKTPGYWVWWVHPKQQPSTHTAARCPPPAPRYGEENRKRLQAALSAVELAQHKETYMYI